MLLGAALAFGNDRPAGGLLALEQPSPRVRPDKGGRDGDAVATPAGQTEGSILFGPFTLRAGERLRTREGIPIELGARALDILIAPISTPNADASKT